MKKSELHNIATTSPVLLQFFASKNPFHVLIKLLPIIGLLTWLLIIGDANWLTSILLLSIGIGFWSLFEYVTHRWIYHINFKNRRVKWFFETFHLYHHTVPKDYRVLNAGLLMIYPLFFLFSGFFFLITLDLTYTAWISFGAITYYFFYENIHYLIHYKEYKKGYLHKIQKFHLYHHYRNWNKNYGNTITIWDKVFRTYDKKYKKFVPDTEHKTHFILKK